MTLILAFGNQDYVIQLSDRRLSSNNQPIDDESNKAGLLVCDDARLVFGFSGLAEIHDTFKTRHWILDTLYECGATDFRAGIILSAFQKRATHDFQTLPVLIENTNRGRTIGCEALACFDSRQSAEDSNRLPDVYLFSL